MFSNVDLEARVRRTHPLRTIREIGNETLGTQERDFTLIVTGSAAIAAVLGNMTANFGGIARDIATQEPSVLLRPEVSVTPR